LETFMVKRVAIYARVSTHGQTVENQDRGITPNDILSAAIHALLLASGKQGNFGVRTRVNLE
jgi:DNA invertase Pin-like site-specific DNA recombinase